MQRERYRLQGLMEWHKFNKASSSGFSIYPATARLPIGYDDIAAAAGRPLSDEAFNGILDQVMALQATASPDNELLAMGQMLNALNNLRAGNNQIALQLANAALTRSRSLYGEGNIALLLGHAVMAQAAYAAGDRTLALRAANAGRALILANPRRATMLGGYHVTFLTIIADLTKSGLANPVAEPGTTPDDLRRTVAALRQEAKQIIARGRSSYQSPYFDIGGLMPLMQRPAEAAWRHETAILQMPSQVSNVLSVLAATLPSTTVVENANFEVPDGMSVVKALAACITAAGKAMDAGNITRAKQARYATYSLINPANMARLVAVGNRRPNESDRDALSNATKALEAAMHSHGETFGTALFVDGEGADLARRLEAVLTPQNVNRIFAVALRLRGEDADKEELAKIRSLRPIIATAVRLMIDMFAISSGEHSPARTNRLINAMRSLNNAGVTKRLAKALSEDEDDPDAVATFRQGLSSFSIALGGFAWVEAKASGAEKLAARVEVDIATYTRGVLAEFRPGATKALAADFAAIRAYKGDILPFRNAANIVATIAATAIMGPDDRENDRLGKLDVEDSLQYRSIGDSLAAVFLMPVAARSGQWDQVLGMERPASAFVAEHLKEEQDDRTMMSLVGGPAISANIDALMRAGRAKEAATFFDSVNPSAAEAGKQDDEGKEQLQQLAGLLSNDQMLDAGIRAHAGAGEIRKAMTLAQTRTERFDQLYNGGDKLEGAGFRAALSPPRPPYEQLIALAASARAADVPWDAVLSAFNVSHRSEAGDAVLLNNAATAAGPDAVKAHARFLRAQSRTGADIGPLSGFRVKSPAAIAEEASGNAEELVAARKALYALLPPDVVAHLTGKMTLADLRRALRPGEIVIAHMVAEGRVAILDVRASGAPRLVWSKLAYADIAAMIAASDREFRLPDTFAKAVHLDTPDANRLRALYDALIAPVADMIAPATHVVWSPDLAISTVPFLALRAPGSLSGAGGASPYLGLAKAVSFAPKLNAFAAARGRAKRAPAPALAIGDIDYAAATRADTTPSGTPGRLGGLAATPNARATIADFVAATHGQALVGQGATRSNVLTKAAGNVGLLLFYTHGSTGSPLRTPALLLGPEHGAAISELSGQDVLSLALRPDLVLLAACTTGAAPSATVQPYGGLVTSFLAKGANAVLTAQRRVDEEAASRLIERIVKQDTASQ